MKKIFVGIAAILLLASAARAQNYSIDWYKISGGGGTSTNGIYSLSGTIGQHDAGGPMTGANFSVTGGFWSLYAVQALGAPKLTITMAGTNTAMISWPSPSTGFHLQVNTNLATTNWLAVPQATNDNGTIRFILVSPPTGDQYYRLKSP